ncbi:Fungal-type protein kinase domain-containing protein [Pleurotus pulmonarius]
MISSHFSEGSLVPNSKFCQRFLNVHNDLDALSADTKLLDLAEKIQDSATTCYDKVETLLNHISTIIYKNMCTNSELLVFKTNNRYTPPHHPNGIETGQPDLVCMPESIAAMLDLDSRKRIPWHLIVSAIEEKQAADARKGAGQCGAYLACGNQSRPDLVGMYGLSISPLGYQLQYSCPAGLTTSDEFDWSDDMIGLVLYVYTLYCPRPDKPPRDPSITLASTNDKFGPPTWNIDVGDKIYKNCRVEFVGQAWMRMTWVVKSGGDEPKIPIMIKDTYRDARTRFKEGEMYEILHRDGTVPGFAAVEREYEVEYAPGRPITVSVNDNECARIKTRLIMQTYGLPLTKCKNIVDFFKGMYDILEAHRFMFLERKLLHRDISHGNIIVHAQDSANIRPLQSETRPVYINEILKGHVRADPMARLIDMDNCAYLGITDAVVEEEDTNDKPLRYCTGTPKFISRSVALGKVLNGDEFKSMPELDADVVEKYLLAYHDDGSDMRKFTDENNTAHGGHLSKQLEKAYRGNSTLRLAHFEHQPRHDAESVYWCIVVFVLLAKPLNNDVDKNIKGLGDIWSSIADHEVGTSNDKRSSLIHDTQWETWLHEDLSFIADLMNDLAKQVRPEWGLLTPAPKPLHLHEAMQRLILNSVYTWETDGINVELDTVTPRPYPKEERRQMAPGRHYPLHGQVFSTRKRANSITGQEESVAKRK